jgi:hypothetical protein
MPISRGHRATLRVALAITLVAAGAIAVVPARAASDSNIPGIPLPGPVTVGELGGDVYDHVYSLSVPPGNVILASLTGDAGTDFDLYLFDSTATSILANPPVGLMAKSTGPTSTESLSYPSRNGGTYFLDLNGASDTKGAFRLSVTIQADVTPPSVSLRIQGAQAAVSDPTVTLTIVAQDALSGVDAMSFSTDGAAWLPWQPYAPTTLWTFPAGDGVKELWVRVRDRAGNVSAPATASTVLDTVPPTVTSVAPPRDAIVGSVRPDVTVTFSKSMTPLWWTIGGLSLHPLGGGPDVPGTFVYSDATRTGIFTPSVDLFAGTIYQAQLNTLYDVAGNRLTPYPAWTFTPKQPVPLTLAIIPPSITSGGSASAVGSAQLPAPAAVELQQMVPGATDWTTVAAQFPDAAGSIRVPLAPTTNTTYRLHVAGGSMYAESTSTRMTLSVRYLVTLAGLAPGVTGTARAGVVQPLLAQLAPAAHGVVVTYRLYRWDAAGKTWKLFVTARRTTNADGLARWSWAQRAGTWYLRATTDATASNAAGVSATSRWLVK